MNNLKKLFSIITVIVFYLFNPGSALAIDLDKLEGPNITDLYMVMIKDPDAQILALEKGEIDLVGDIASPALIKKLSQKKEEISLSLARSFHTFVLGFNLRKEPWNHIELRQAACQAIPRETLVRDLFSGYAEPIETFLPPVSPYYTSDVEKYPYNLELARKRLSDSGWRWNDDGILIPPGTDTPLEPMTILSPTASVAPTTSEISIRIAEALTSIGIPIKSEPMDFSSMVAKLNQRKFDGYVMAWSLSRDPDVLYAFYSSAMDVPGGYNISGISDPLLDKELTALRYAPDRESAEKLAKKTQRRLSHSLPVIPIYSRYSISAIRKEWKNYVATKAMSVDNIWTLLSVVPREGPMKPFKSGLRDDPQTLNPLTSSTNTAWSVLTLIYESLIEIDPATLEDRPGLATDWKVETISDGDAKKTRITLNLRKGVTWQDGTAFTSTDPADTIKFIKKNKIPRFYDQVVDVEKIETPDPNTLIVTMDKVSYWDFHNIAGLIVLPSAQLASIEDWQTWQPLNHWKDGLSALMGTGPFILKEYRPGEYVSFKRNDSYWRTKK